MCPASSIDKFEPIRANPYTLNEDPNRTNERTLIELPI
jgi:hypothetical protein